MTDGNGPPSPTTTITLIKLKINLILFTLPVILHDKVIVASIAFRAGPTYHKVYLEDDQLELADSDLYDGDGRID